MTVHRGTLKWHNETDAWPTPRLRFFRYRGPFLNGSGMERAIRLRANDLCVIENAATRTR
jgi:hypothetical protein